MITIRIQTEDFNIGEEVARLKESGDAGAVVTFTGSVRRDSDVESMMLEHYPGMTEREIARHMEEAQARWSLLRVTIIHRVGKLVPGDNIVLVAVASMHRHDGFAAAEFLMDYLKTRAPFWKSEQRAGNTAWVEARDSDEAAANRWREG